MSDNKITTWPEAFVACFGMVLVFVAHMGLPIGLLVWLLWQVGKTPTP